MKAKSFRALQLGLGGMALLACHNAPAGAPPRPEQSCGETFRDPTTEFAAIAMVNPRGPLDVVPVFDKTLEAGRHYALVDDIGFLGTLRASEPALMKAAMDGCCTTQSGVWVDAPTREAQGLPLAFGPVNGRFASARRRLPAPIKEGEGTWSWSFIQGSTAWRTLAHFDFDSEPRAFDVRGRVCETDERVVELRALEGGTWRVVARHKIPKSPQRQLD